MSIDVASLIFEIDSTQAVVARERLEALESVGGRVDVAARKVKTATQMAGIGMDGVAEGAKRATRAATEHADALGAVGKAALAAEREATRAAAREDAAWAKVAATIEKRNAAYRGSQALAAIKAETAATLELDRAIDAAVRGHAGMIIVQGRVIGSSKALTQAGLNLTRQLADIGVTAAMGMNPLMILIQQGPQIADAFQMAKTQGLGFNDVIKGLAASAGLLAISVPPAVAQAASLAVAEQAAAAAAVEVAVANRAAAATAVTSATANQALATTAAEAAAAETALAVATGRQVVANEAASVAAAQLAAANVVVAETATAAAAAETAALTPLAALLAGIAVTLALVFGSAALAARGLNKDNKDLADSLGLTQKQLDQLEKKGVNTGVTIGDVFKGTFNYIRDAVGPALAPVAEWFSKLFDGIAAAGVATVKIVGGAFVGAYAAIKATWSALPAALGDIAVQTGNAVVRAIEDMINKALNAYNKALPLIRSLMTATGGGAAAMLLREAGPVDLGQSANPWAGAAGKAVAEGAEAFRKANEGWSDTVDSVGKGLRKSILDVTSERIRKASGDAGKEPKASKGAAAPRDQTDERTAQIEAMIQAALADELQARLGVTREIEARADLERQIARAQEAVKAAQIAGRQATLDEDLQRKRISQATYDELSGQLKIVASINARAAAYREQAINEAEAIGKAKEAFDLQASAIELQIDVLASQEAAAKYEFERRAIGLERLKLEQQLERITLEQVTVKNGALAIDELIAAARLAELGRIHENQTRAATGDYQDAYRRVTDALNDVSRAFESKDWNALATSIVNAIGTLREAFKKAGGIGDKIAAVAGIGQMIGGLVGGKAGGAISGAASGAMGGAQLGTMLMPGIGTAIGAIAGGILGGVTSLLGGDKEKKRQKAQQEAADIANAQAIAQGRANQQADLQLRILELSGDEVGALAMRREAELAALDGANRALAEHIHKLEDWAKGVSLAKDAVAKAEDDLRAAYEADRDRLLGIIGGVETARDRLNQAYQRERGVIEGTISSVRSLVDSLSAFRGEMDMMAAANDPSRQYGYASRQFATASNDNLIERGRAFAEASQSASATDLDFQRDLAAVRRRTDEASKTAQTQLTTAERQLLALDAMVIPLLGVNDNLISVEEAIRGLTTAEQMALMATEELARLDAQVGALITINSSVLSVAQAISNLNGAISALASAQASKPSEGASGQGSQAVGLTGYVDKNADLAALYASGSGMAAGRTKEQFAAYHWERYGQAEGRTYTAFARGGDHMGGLRLVGEEGPELEATGPSRIYNARQTAQMLGGDTARLEALVETLTDKVEELTKLQRTDNFEIKRNTKDSADIMAKVTQGADTVRVKAA